MRRVRIALVMVLVLFLSTPASSTRTNPWGQSGGGDGVAGTGNYAAMTAYTASVGDLWWLVDQATAVCTSDGGGTADTLCAWDGAAWIAAGVAGGGWVGTATSDLAMGANDITLSATQTVDGVDVSDQSEIDRRHHVWLEDFGTITLRRESLEAAALQAERDANETAFGLALADACSTTTVADDADGGVLMLPQGRIDFDPASIDIDCRVTIQGTSDQSGFLGGTELYVDTTSGGPFTHGFLISSDYVTFRDVMFGCRDAADFDAGFECVRAIDDAGDTTDPLVELKMESVRIVSNQLSAGQGGVGLMVNSPQQIAIDGLTVQGFEDAMVIEGDGAAGGNWITNSNLNGGDGEGSCIYIDGADPFRDFHFTHSTCQNGAVGLEVAQVGTASVLYTKGVYYEQICTDTGGTCDNGPAVAEASLLNVALNDAVSFVSDSDFYNPSSITNSVQRTVAQTGGADQYIAPWFRSDVDYQLGACTTTGIVAGAGDISDCTTFVNPSSTVAWTGAHDFGGATSVEIPNTVVGSLPAATLGLIAIVTDGDDGNDCTTGGGSTQVECMGNGSTWEATGGTDVDDSPTWTGDHVFDGTLALGTRETFTDVDTTPDVGTGAFFITNTTGVTISDFDGAGIVAGQVITVESNGAIVYDCTTSGFQCGSTDITTAAGDLTTWLYDGADWHLIGFTDQSEDMGTDAGAGSTPFTDDTVNLYPTNTADDLGVGWDGGGTAASDFAVHIDAVTGTVTANVVTVRPGSAPAVLMEYETTGTQGGLAITSETGTGASADGVTALQTDVAGALTPFVEADGVTETVDLLKPVTASSTVAVEGALTGRILQTFQSGTTHSPTDENISGAAHYYSNTGAVTVTLPQISTTGEGYSACFYDLDGTAALIIDPHADDQIRLAGVLDATGGDAINATTPTAGDFICLSARDNGTDDEWISWGSSGDWAAD